MKTGDVVEIITTNQAGVFPGDIGILEDVLPDGYGVKLQVRTQNLFGGQSFTEVRTVFFKKEEIKEHDTNKAIER